MPIRRKLYFILGIMVLNLAAVISAGVLGMSVLSSLRAYVGGESLWAKAQKKAISDLNRYAASRDEKDYRAFLDDLKVPRGDRRSRQELQKASPDYAVSDAGFLEGKNHPEDIPGMTRLFRRFNRVPDIHRAIRIWTQADEALSELAERADRLHQLISSNSPARDETRAVLAEIGAIDERLTRLENDFSYALGETSRWAKRTLFWAMVSGSALLGGLSFLVALLLSRSIAEGVQELSRAAARAAQGDLNVRVEASTQDELGRLAEAFNRMVAGLSALDRLKNDFIATVSHELRTPLTLALAPLDTLLGEVPDPESGPRRRLLELARANALRLLQMVNGLLDFSKLEAGRLQARREPLELASLTRAIVADFGPLFERKGLHASFEATPATIAAMMDRYLYERIVFNLLSNAAKFTPSGGSVLVRLARDGERVVLSVADTGIGIARADQTGLFQKFRQVESSSTRRFEGTGLGLALVKEFAELLRGTVSLKSAPGEGSLFTVDCLAPACPEEALAPSPPGEVPKPLAAETAAPLRREDSDAPSEGLPRILVAEDNPELAGYLGLLLRGLGRVEYARDGEQALALVRAEAPRLVLADVMMPKRDGLSLCREIKKLPSAASVPVVLLTALTEREALLRGWEAGADDYLFKPFHPQEVLARVRSLLSFAQARQRAEEALAQRTLELERSNADLEQFAFVAAHDLQEPLRKIVAFSEILEARYAGQLDAKARDLLSRASGSALRMREQVNDLLEYARLGRPQPPAQSVDSQSAFRRAVKNLETAIEESGAEVACGALPAVSANAGELARIFQNLIANAVKFRGEEPPSVRVEAVREGDLWRFSVRDNGIGIDMRYRDRLFVPFERLQPKAAYPGSGIGLAVCKRIVERRGGRIWAESEPGRGSTFYFTLPAEGESHHERPA